jgi:hypothetical protein
MNQRWMAMLSGLALFLITSLGYLQSFSRFCRLSLALSITSHMGLLCPRRLASEALGGSALHLEEVVLFAQGSCAGQNRSPVETLSLPAKAGELGSAWRAASATENANILSGVGSGEEGV